MRKVLFSLVICVAFLGSVVTATGQTTMPRLNFRERTLPNGLHVLSVVDQASPTVAINVWYHVGSKDDPDRRSGFAHLFEHIMFKSKKNIAKACSHHHTESSFTRFSRNRLPHILTSGRRLGALTILKQLLWKTCRSFTQRTIGPIMRRWSW